MKRLLQFLWSGCWHVWGDTGEGTFEDGSASGSLVTCKCKKCGAHTYFKHARKATRP